jgi:two-component system nitrogen regulation response regulator GlnG
VQDDWARALEQWARGRAHAGGEPLLDAALPEFERTLIRVALARSEGRRQDAARLLGWGRNTLTRKMRELGMDGDADEEPTAA